MTTIVAKSPQSDTDESPDIESATDAYARRFAGPVGAYFLETQLRIVQGFIPNGSKILDVGGGHAQLAVPLSQAGFHVTVLGSHPQCQRRLERLLPGVIPFTVGNLLQLPFPDDSFDVVLAFRLLPHLNGWKQFIAELCRVASHAIIFDYPDIRSVNSFASPFFSLKKKIEKNTRAFRCFCRQDIHNELKRNGFEMEAAVPQYFVPMALHRLISLEAMSRTVEGLAAITGLTHRLGSPVIVKAVRNVD